MEKIKWGIVGAGRIAASFAEALRASTDSECYAVASRNKVRGDDFSKKWGFQKSYSDYESLLADPEVDAVYIATPHMNHASLSIAALKAGKAVLCEKAATVNAKELQNVYQVVNETKGLYMEAMWTKFNPTFRKALEWVASGRIGKLKAIYADFCIARTADAVYRDLEYPMNRLYDINLAGGALLDVGIYPVTCALSMVEAALGGDAAEVQLFPEKIEATARMTDTGVDAFDSISLKIGDVVASLSCSIDTECGSVLKEARIVGTEGTIILPFFWMAQEAQLISRDEQLVDSCSQPFAVNGYEYEIAEFCKCIKTRRAGLLVKESLLHTHAQSLRVIKVLDAIRSRIGLVYPFENSGYVIKDETQVVKEVPGKEVKSKPNMVTVYTDGGCSGNPGPGGWGCVILADGMEYTVSGGETMTTNNRMELSAAIAALSAIDQNEVWRTQSITVHIDSQYVKNGITSWIKSWQRNGWRNSEKQPVKNRDLWEVLDELNKKLNVTWKWVKGHAGNKYNEMCDAMATQEVRKYSR